jgi:hypothetical protein
MSRTVAVNVSANGRRPSAVYDASLANELIRLPYADFVSRLQDGPPFSKCLPGEPIDYDVSVIKVKTATQTVQGTTILENALTPLGVAVDMIGSEADITEITVLIVPSSEFAQQLFSLSFAVLSHCPRPICLSLYRLFFGIQRRVCGGLRRR